MVSNRHSNTHEKLWRSMEVLGGCGNRFRVVIRRIGNPPHARQISPNDVEVVELIGVPGGI